MTRILSINDIHLTDRPPSTINEGYTEDLFEMLKYAAMVEQKLSCDAVVWAGDVFHYKQPLRTPHSLVLRAIESAKRFKNLWVIAGNHDLTQDRLDSLFAQQPLGVLIESGAAQFLDGWHPTLPLYGVNWRQDWHHEPSRSDAFKKWRERGVDHASPAQTHGFNLDSSLVVTHAPIYPPGLENDWDAIPTGGPEGISAAMGNRGFITYGHIHDHHGIFEVEGVTYCNPGALSRGSLNESNLNRPIKLTLWDSELGFREVPVPHKPGSEIFKVQEKQEAQAAERNLDAFLADVGSSRLAVSSTESVISHIQNHAAIEKPVKDLAVEILEEVG